jgi:hypothetical protein
MPHGPGWRVRGGHFHSDDAAWSRIVTDVGEDSTSRVTMNERRPSPSARVTAPESAERTDHRGLRSHRGSQPALRGRWLRWHKLLECGRRPETGPTGTNS